MAVKMNDNDAMVAGGQNKRRPIPRRVARWLGKAALVLGAIVLAATGAGKIQQARLAAAYPPPGELIAVGDSPMHVLRNGTGPTVVFENGPGGLALDWSLVTEQVSEFAATVSYDRAGLGWSEPTNRPRDIATLVADLDQMLQASDARAPYVLVGHSYGGLIVRAYAYAHPEKVAGLVLVDAAHEDQLERYPAEYAAKAETLAAAMRRLRPVYRLAVGSGVPALLGATSDDVSAGLPEEIARARRAATVMDSSHATTSVDEMSVLYESLDHVRRIRRPLGDVPVVVITHGRPVGSEAGVPAGLEDAVEAAWQGMQTSLLEISDQSRLIVAENSGHNIHVEAPELVVEAIRHIVDR